MLGLNNLAFIRQDNESFMGQFENTLEGNQL